MQNLHGTNIQTNDDPNVAFTDLTYCSSQQIQQALVTVEAEMNSKLKASDISGFVYGDRSFGNTILYGSEMCSSFSAFVDLQRRILKTTQIEIKYKFFYSFNIGNFTLHTSWNVRLPVINQNELIGPIEHCNQYQIT